MSTSSDISNNQRSYLRRISKNKNCLNINIPLKLAKLSKIKASDYMVINYEDQRNRLILSKLQVNTGGGNE
ncbi:MAG TPA: hypothetical protein VHJ38_11360 [Nitrososphaeraceae archaeon]|jgi:hypothetical protein|nr:hypothetical protein [Nitrososphaeraceae archaeon]